MKISIVCSSGSPIGVIPPDIDGKGVGGAELALLTTSEELAKAGHDVVVYNNPRICGKHGLVEYRTLGEYRNGGDALIVFRTPFPGVVGFKGRKIFWSCDQYTTGSFDDDIFPFVDKVVTISPFHTEYFLSRYRISKDKITDIGIGVRTWEYERPVEKIPGRVIYCSVPNRGLEQLHGIWLKLKEAHPELSLVITSDYRLWGAAGPMNETYRQQWRGAPDVQFLGKISRSELVQHQLQSEWMFYPCTYDELFCIALAECQVAGVLPITSATGALTTTNAMGLTIPGDPTNPKWQESYVDIINAAMNKRSEIFSTETIKKYSKTIFGFGTVLMAWEEVLS